MFSTEALDRMDMHVEREQILNFSLLYQFYQIENLKYKLIH